MKWQRFCLYPILALVFTGVGYFMGHQSDHQSFDKHGDPSLSRQRPTTQQRDNSQSSVKSYRELSEQLKQWHGNDRIARNLAEIERMDLASVQKMTREMLASGANNYFDEGGFTSMLIDKWARLDPQGLMAEGLKQNSYAREQFVGAAFQQLARVDFHTAWEQVNQLEGYNRALAAHASLEVLAEDDPVAAIQFLEKNQSALTKPDDALKVIIDKWITKDGVAAANYVLAMPDSAKKSEMLDRTMQIWGSSHVDEAIAWAEKLDTPHARNQALQQAVSYLSYSDPQKLIDLVKQKPQLWAEASNAVRNLARYDFAQAKSVTLGMQNPVQKQLALSALAASGTDYHADDLLALASTLPIHEAKSIYSSDNWWYGTMTAEQSTKWLEQIPEGPLRDQSRQNLISRMSYENPDAAAKMYKELPDSMKNHGYLVSDIASRYSQTDPKKALAWAKELGSFAQQKSAYASIFASLANTSPDTAAAAFASVSDPAMRKEITGNLASTWACSDLAAAEKWANSLPAEEKNRAMSSMANALVQSNPDQAQKFIEQLAQQNTADFWKSNENKQVISRITAQVADTDPRAAAKWIEKLPVGPAQDSGYASLVSTWAVYEPNAAGTWLSQMPAGETRNQATSNYVGVIAKTDPQGAYDWAVTIDDSAVRREAAKQALLQWKENGGKEQAMQSLQQNQQFTEQERNELIKALE